MGVAAGILSRGGLNIGFDTEYPIRHGLPVVADLPAANRAHRVGGFFICDAKRGEITGAAYLTETRVVRGAQTDKSERRAGKIDGRFLLAPIPARVQTGIEPGPAINGCRYRPR